MYIDGCACPLVCVSPCMWPSGCGKGVAGSVTGSCQVGAARSQKARECDRGIQYLQYRITRDFAVMNVLYIVT